MNSFNGQGPDSKKKKWVGIVFLVIGLLLLCKQLGLFIPDWIFSWPMILILAGVVTGKKHNYQNPASYILIIVGVVFLIDRIFTNVDFHDFLWPVLIIGVGLHLILGKKNRFRPNTRPNVFGKDEWDKRVYEEESANSQQEEADPIKDKHENTYSADDYLDTVAVFGGVKKNIVSKNFKEGDVTTIMGGAELNFIQADIKGTAVLEVTQLFGGTKIIVPQQWKIASEMVAVFGGVEDKRPIVHGAVPSEEKVLIIRGTSIFGGIDIRSY